jgi:hypothetical protein
MDMHDYLIVFTNKEIIAPESHLQGVNENEWKKKKIARNNEAIQ